MRVLLSTIGSRGDFQPLLALGLQLRELGREVRLCAPPDFRGLAEGHGLPFVPIGPELLSEAVRPANGERPSFEDLKKGVLATVGGQFTTLRKAAEDCEVIVGCNQLQVAARSVAELRGIRYVFADYSPISMPSSHHAPPQLPGRPPPWRDVIDDTVERLRSQGSRLEHPPPLQLIANPGVFGAIGRTGGVVILPVISILIWICVRPMHRSLHDR